MRGEDGRWKRVERAARAARDREAAGRPATASRTEARLGVGADGQLRQDKHLPAIAAMLDETAVRAHRPARRAGLVAIQGSAGSGKTTVGLHRVAYLAFAEPQRFRPDKMVVVVPNEALIHYVSRVLPSLGVEGVPVTTFARFAARLVGADVPEAADAGERGDAAGRVARQVARGDAPGHRAPRRRASRATVDARLRAGDGASGPRGERVVAALGGDAGRGDAAAGRARVAARGVARGQAAAAGRARRRAELPEVTRSALEQLGAQLRHETRVGRWASGTSS